MTLHTSTSYHPQSSGLVERYQRSLRSVLCARMTSLSWSNDLPWVILGLRLTPKADLWSSPASWCFMSFSTSPRRIVHRKTLAAARFALTDPSSIFCFWNYFFSFSWWCWLFPSPVMMPAMVLFNLCTMDHIMSWHISRSLGTSTSLDSLKPAFVNVDDDYFITCSGHVSCPPVCYDEGDG